MTYHRITLTNYTKYISIAGNISLVIADYGNGKYGYDTFTSGLATAAVRTTCNDLNKISKEDFDAVKEKAKIK